MQRLTINTTYETSFKPSCSCFQCTLYAAFASDGRVPGNQIHSFLCRWLSRLVGTRSASTACVKSPSAASPTNACTPTHQPHPANVNTIRCMEISKFNMHWRDIPWQMCLHALTPGRKLLALLSVLSQWFPKTLCWIINWALNILLLKSVLSYLYCFDCFLTKPIPKAAVVTELWIIVNITSVASFLDRRLTWTKSILTPFNSPLTRFILWGTKRTWQRLRSL